MSSGNYLSISEVVKRLQVQYPDLTVSKVRFLEDKSLIQPLRTPSGYRKFSPEDVARLEAILKMQKMYFYPLSVIKSKLSEVDKGTISLASSDFGYEDGENAVSFLADKPQPLSAIVDMLGIPSQFLRDLSEYGLITIEKGENSPVIDGSLIPLIQATYKLSEFGIHPRHLRPLVSAADREATLSAQVVLPSLTAGMQESKLQGQHTLHELETIFGLVRGSLFASSLSKKLEGYNEQNNS